MKFKNMFKRKSFIKILVPFCLLSALSIGVGTTIFATTSCACSGTTDANREKYTLTNAKVRSHFNDIWQTKTSLVADDFKNYKYITIDAFDNLPKKLESIELSNEIIISTKEPKKFKYSIIWKDIDAIKVKEVTTNPDQINLIIHNNILYIRSSKSYQDRFWASTISDRITKGINISFPKISEGFFKHFKTKIEIGISADFYNAEIFKNVNQITFLEHSNAQTQPDDILETIGQIGENAFKNCHKLNESLIFCSERFNVLSTLYFGFNCFQNTNIKEFILLSNSNVIISNLAFNGNKNLNKILILDIDVEQSSGGSYLYLTDNVFSECSSTLDTDLFCENLYFGQHVFKNQYDKFNLMILPEESNVDFDPAGTSLAGINVDINSFTLKSFLSSNKLSTSGLTPEQIAKNTKS